MSTRARLVKPDLILLDVMMPSISGLETCPHLSLHTVHKRLEQARDELEDRVQRRTAELPRLKRELRAISECNQTLLRATDEQTLLSDICRS